MSWIERTFFRRVLRIKKAQQPAAELRAVR